MQTSGPQATAGVGSRAGSRAGRSLGRLGRREVVIGARPERLD